MENIHISNMYVEVPATKPDAGYEYEGPTEDMPRNISPGGIAGMPDALIDNVTLKNIEIRYPGGGTKMFAGVGLADLNKVPEKPEFYQEFYMFDDLPAWGLYVRHAKNIKVEGLKLSCEKKDYRTGVVLDDVHWATFDKVKISKPDKRDWIFSLKSTNVQKK